MNLFTAMLTTMALLASASAEAQTIVITRGGSRAVRPARRRTSRAACVSRCCSRRSIPHTQVAGPFRSSPVPAPRGTRIPEVRS